MRTAETRSGMTHQLSLPAICRAGVLLAIFIISANAQAPNPTTTTQPTTQPIFKLSIENCLKASADATMTVQKSAQGYLFSHVESNGTAYVGAAGSCGRFVADVTVPKGFKLDPPMSQIKITGQYGAGEIFDQSNCANASLHVSIYVKNRTGFSKLYEQSGSGTWKPSPDMGIPAYCEFPAVKTPLKIAVPESGIAYTSLYRVIVLPVREGSHKPARVSWHWQL